MPIAARCSRTCTVCVACYMFTQLHSSWGQGAQRASERYGEIQSGRAASRQSAGAHEWRLAPVMCSVAWRTGAGLPSVPKPCGHRMPDSRQNARSTTRSEAVCWPRGCCARGFLSFATNAAGGALAGMALLHAPRVMATQQRERAGRGMSGCCRTRLGCWATRVHVGGGPACKNRNEAEAWQGLRLRERQHCA